jgi:hypothetical protein
MQHKRKVDKERKMKVIINNQLRYNLEEDSGNLNIVRLKPSMHQHLRRRQTLET